jgi:hypothetical protein
MKNLHYYVFVFLIVILLESCRGAYDEIDIGGDFSPEIAVPLVESQVRLDDLMEGLGADTYLEVRPDGLYQMQYNGKFSKEKTINVISTFPNPVNIPIKDRITLQQFSIPDGMAIDSAIFKKGSFKWTMKNDNSNDAKVRIYIYELTKNGQNFEKTFDIKARQTFTGTLDLDGWCLKLANVGALYIFYDAFIDGQQGYEMTGTYEFSGMEAKKTVGYFGTNTLTLDKSSLNLDFFKKWTQRGEAKFLEPSVTITVENGLGMPVDIKTRTAEATKKDGSKLPVTNTFLTNGFPANYPNFNEVGTSKRTTIKLTQTNSNIVEIINAYPTALDFAFDACPNPDLNNKSAGHVADNAHIKMKMDATIPMVLAAKNFVLLDSIDIDFSKFQEVQTAEFKINTDNSIPVDILMQAYFMSASGQVLDSLVQDNTLVLKSAVTNATGQVTRSTSNTSFIKIAAEKLNKVRGAKWLLVKFELTTSKEASVPVQLLQEQKVIMNIGVKALTKL